MPANDATHGGEADARAFEFLGAVEPLKHAEQFVRVLHVEPDAIVPHEENHAPAFCAGGADVNPGGLAHPRVLDGVVDEVGQHLLDHRRVPDHAGQGADLPDNGPAGGHHFEAVNHVGDHGGKGHRSAHQVGPAHAGKGQQVVDQAPHLDARVADGLQVMRGLVRQLSVGGHA